MSFLNEEQKVTVDDPKKAKELQDAGVENIHVVDEIIDEANAFLAAADSARDAGKKEFEFPKGSGKMHKVTLKRDLDLDEGKLSTALGGVAVLAGLLLMGKINSSDPVIQRLQAEYELAEPAQQDSIKNLMSKRLLFLDTGKADAGTPMKEDIGDTLFGTKNTKRPFSNLMSKLVGDPDEELKSAEKKAAAEKAKKAAEN